MTKPGAALVVAALLAAGCGGAEAQPRSRIQSCAGVPEPISRNGPVAVPQPVSPEGALSSWASEYWAADVALAEGGLCVVSQTEPGTFALTGVVVDGGGPVRRARVTLEAVPSSLGITLEALTDEHGAFAFANVPVSAERTCYRETIVAFGSTPWTNVDWMSPGEYGQSVELDLPHGPASEGSCSESS